MTVRLEGVRISLSEPDLDGDGKTGGVEVVQRRDLGLTEVTQATELGETLREINDDSIEETTRMSSIDMKARITGYEELPILAMDTLVALKICPTSCLSFTRQKKRLSVSRNGEGRKEMVDIVAGKRQHDVNLSGGGGFGDWIKGKFGMGSKED